MIRKQSFTKSVKEELCFNEYESLPRLKALLSSYIRITGTIVFRNRRSLLVVRTENAKIAKFIYTSLTSLYGEGIHLAFKNKGNMKTVVIYEITIDEKAEAVLSDLKIDFLEGKVPKEIVYNDDTISGYLAGAFLASGSVNSPETSNYHLELSFNSENYAKWISHLFGRYKNSNIEPRIALRREKYIVYFKKSDQIAVFLIMIGAVNACMEFETYRTTRDFTNSNNRTMNLDTANMSKTVETGERQVREIQKLDQALGIDNISNDKLKALCRIRLAHESASLQELADLLSEELEAPVTKSNVNHLMRKLHEMVSKVGKR